MMYREASAKCVRSAILAFSLVLAAGCTRLTHRHGQGPEVQSLSSGGITCCAISETQSNRISPSESLSAFSAVGSGSCSQPHELPVVSNWNSSTYSYSLGASDQYALRPSTNGACVYRYAPGFTPYTDQYVGDSFSLYAPDNATVVAWADQMCQRVGVPYRFLRPDAVPGGRLQDQPGVVQVVNGMVVSNSMVTVILPPNWVKGSAPGRYPILFQGHYDSNDNTFGRNGEGPLIQELIGRSGLNGYSGAIGVIWNGGGAAASRTITQGARRQGSDVIDYVAQTFGGDRSRIIALGASRGGGTALQLASNPDPHNYSIRLVYAMVPPTKLGFEGRMLSATFPYLLDTGWSLGLDDSWKPGWRYPACGGHGDLTGLDLFLSSLKVIAGQSDFGTADAIDSPISDRFIAALKAAGTEVVLDIGSHDFAVPYGVNIEYLNRLRSAGIPVEANIYYRAGHFGSFGYLKDKLTAALDGYTAPGASGNHPHVDNGAVRYYQVDRTRGALVAYDPPDGRLPFTLDVPRRLYEGMPIQLLATAEPGTEYEIDVAGSQITGTIDGTWNSLIDLGGGVSPGLYTYTAVKIKKPGADWKSLNLRDTPSASGMPLTTEVLARGPNLTGQDVSAILQQGRDISGGFVGVNWGISETSAGSITTGPPVGSARGAFASVTPSCTIPAGATTCPISMFWAVQNAPQAGIRARLVGTAGGSQVCIGKLSPCTEQTLEGRYVVELRAVGSDPNSPLLDSRTVSAGRSVPPPVPGIVTISVTNKTTGSPIAEAIVEIDGAAEPTDANGKISGPLALGLHHGKVTALGFVAVEEDFTYSGEAILPVAMTPVGTPIPPAPPKIVLSCTAGIGTISCHADVTGALTGWTWISNGSPYAFCQDKRDCSVSGAAAGPHAIQVFGKDSAGNSVPSNVAQVTRR